MYNKHFGIDENPFSIAPDPRYLYMSEGHREAFAHLLFGVTGDGGFVLLTGEVGTGKTTVCRCLLEQIPDDSNIALILNPKVTVLELLASICDELRIKYPEDTASVKTFVDKINFYLLESHAQGKKTVLIIDEAQNLDSEVLEQIRLLTNLETNRYKLLQIIMLGQPELLDKLALPDLRQLAQRITARHHLGPLQKKEIASYVTHRLSVAGLTSKIFSSACINRLYKLSGGIPRLINSLCDRAMLGAFSQGQNYVDETTLKKAAREVFGDTDLTNNKKSTSSLGLAFAIALVAGSIALATTYIKYEHDLLNSAPASMNGINVPQKENNDKKPEPDEISALPDRNKVIDNDQTTEIQPSLTEKTDSQTIPEKMQEWPADLPFGQSKSTSFTSLFTAWNFKYNSQENDDACVHAETIGLQCLHLRGDFNNLIQLNRPAILRLYNAHGERYYTTLTEVTEQNAVFTFNNLTKKFAFNKIADHWFGHFTILWKPPEGYRNNIYPYYKGAEIEWLDRQLASLNKRTLQPLENLAYNKLLVNEIKEFQLSNSLAPDGILGPETLIHINSAIDLDVPKLKKRAKEE